MTVKRKKVVIDAEVRTDAGVKAWDKLTAAERKAEAQTGRVDSALKKVRLEFQVQQARVKNLEDRYKAYDAALKRNAQQLRQQASLNKRLGLSMSGLEEKLSGVAKFFGRSNREAQSFAEGAGGALRSIGKAGRALGPALGIGAVALTGAAVGAAELAQESLELQNIFKNLPFSLNAARSATKGLADDTTLARNAIVANQSGVATSARAYANLVGMAQTLALKMGRDVNETVERVTLGLAKQEREILDELVVIPRMTDIWEDFARQTGRTTDELSDAEKNTAFLEAAQKALSDATKGVEVDMDGLAGSIARTTVQAKNLKAQLLGAEERSITLRQGVQELTAEQIRTAAVTGDYRSNWLETTAALNDVGVSNDRLRKSQVELAEELQHLLKSESVRLLTLAKQGELDEENAKRAQALIDSGVTLNKVVDEQLRKELDRLGLSKAAAAAAADLAEEDATLLELKRESLIETENEIEFLKARGGKEGEINELVLEQLELKAEILEADGKLEDAAKIRRDLELERVRQEGAALRRRRGGKRKDIEFDLDAIFGNTERALVRIQSQEERAMNALARTGKGASERFKQLTEDLERSRQAMKDLEELFVDIDERIKSGGLFQIDPQNNPFSPENLERQLTNVIDFEARRSQVVLDSRMREIAELQAAGLDPIQRMEMEAEAQRQHLERVQAAEQERFSREIMLAEGQGRLAEARVLRAEREVSAVEYQGQVEATEHAVALASIQERQQVEQRQMEQRIALVKKGADVSLQAAANVARATILEGQSLAKSVAGVAKSLAFEHGLKAASEGVNAAIAAASYRYDAAAQHTANAAASAAIAATAAAVAAAAGASTGRSAGVGGATLPGSSRAGGSGPFGTANFGSANASQLESEANTAGRGSDLGQGVPISEETTAQVSGEATGAANGAGTVVVNQQINVTTLGRPDEETMVKMQKSQRAAASRIGRLSAGGRR